MILYVSVVCTIFFFFFQAEDGIRDGRVTGVQTCALPILSSDACELPPASVARVSMPACAAAVTAIWASALRAGLIIVEEIGRASCRERVENSGGAGSLKKKKKREVESEDIE